VIHANSIIFNAQSASWFVDTFKFNSTFHGIGIVRITDQLNDALFDLGNKLFAKATQDVRRES
jgi:hypothetical protein